MEQQYWLITYSWVNADQKRIISHDVHHGTMWSWIDKALEQPEYWRLFNQIQIDKDQYINLKERI